MMTCSVGIFAYNEEKNISQLLESLLQQKLKNIEIQEMLVVVSASTDKTYDIVKKYHRQDKRIRLIKQENREGKASAVNLFIQKSQNEIVVLLGADLLLPPQTIQLLVGKFNDPEVGMTGARPVPVNKITDGICGFASHLLWDLHHRISLVHPKMGEAVAFRKIFRRIPVLSSVDEANIEPLIRGQGYKILYVPEAKIYNKGPTTISDFIQQRKRIYNGHLAVKHEQSYEVATFRSAILLSALFSFMRENHKPAHVFYIPLVVFLEAYSRFLGWWEYTFTKKKYTVWDMVESTKELKRNRN